jgi:hypothetical protein
MEKPSNSKVFSGMWNGAILATALEEFNGYRIGDKLKIRPEHESNPQILNTQPEIVGFTPGGNAIIKLVGDKHTLLSPASLSRFYTKRS